jgi:hypothetical protein
VSSVSWAKELRTEVHDLKQSIAMRGLADYIAFTFMPEEQNEIIKHLQDPTKTTRIEFSVIDKTNAIEVQK